MKIEVRITDTYVVMVIEGHLLQENVHEFRTRMWEALEQEKRVLIIDLEQCSYVSSMCLAALVEAKNRLDAVNGRLIVARPNPLVSRLLELTNLSKKIESFGYLDEAEKSVLQKPA